MKNQKLFIVPLLAALLFTACKKTTSNNQTEPGNVRPNSENAGVPKSVILKIWNGPQYNSQSDLIVDGYELKAPASGYYTFAGNNVTVRNCKLYSGVLFAGNNIKIEHCEIIGGASLSGTATASIVFNNIHSSEDDGIHITSDRGRVSNVTVANNFIHSFAPACGAHADGIQVRGVDGLTISGNVIDMGAWRRVCGLNALNAAIFLQDANGGNKNITVDGNYLNGGGYVIYIGIGPNTRIVNNRIGRDEKFGLFSNTSNPGDIVAGTGNVRDNNNESVSVR